MAVDVAPKVKVALPQILADLWLIPISAAFLLFLIRARKGYALHGARVDSFFLPPSFREAIQFIREMQNPTQGKQGNEIDGSANKTEH